MGYHTLSGNGSLAARVAADLGEKVLLQHQAGDTVHTLIERPSGFAAYWVVSLVRSGMVKHMDETVGPYCNACSAEFLAKALELCGEAPTEWAQAFRDRMFAALIMA